MEFSKREGNLLYSKLSISSRTDFVRPSINSDCYYRNYISFSYKAEYFCADYGAVILFCASIIVVILVVL